MSRLLLLLKYQKFLVCKFQCGTLSIAGLSLTLLHGWGLTEKRLMVDAAELREQYLQRKMLLFWIPTGENAADAFTKVTGDFRALDGCRSGTLNLRLNAWVEHIRERRSEEDDQALPLH
jgi:hypothetical protein